MKNIFGINFFLWLIPQKLSSLLIAEKTGGVNANEYKDSSHRTHMKKVKKFRTPRFFGSSTLIGSLFNFFNPTRNSEEGEQKEPQVEQHIRKLKTRQG